MTKERKILLILLGVLTFIFALREIHYYLGSKKEVLEEKIQLTGDQLIGISKEEPVKQGDEYFTKASVLQLYQSQNRLVSLYPFGQEIKESFENLGLKVSRYQEIKTASQSAIEFHVEGKMKNMLTFLESAKTSSMKIDSFTLDNQDSPARMSVRISPLILPEDFPKEWKEQILKIGTKEEVPPLILIRTWNPYQLSLIFPRESVSVTRAVVKQVPSLAEEAQMDRNSINFVGKISPDNTHHLLYFKDNRNGRVFSLSLEKPETNSGWRVIEQPNNTYILEYENMIYEVRR
jgi:hypothetical protein